MLAVIKDFNTGFISGLVEIITIGLADAPPRPTPGPTPPDPSQPHPEHPIWGPPGFGPGAGFPDKPGFPTIPFPPKPPGLPTGAFNAFVYPLPPTDPPEVPPAGMPPDSRKVVIWFGQGTLPTYAWVQPYADAAPPKPAEPAPPA